MMTKQKNGNIEKNNQRLNIKLGIIYFLLVILFISLLFFL
jgi:hypothetical protein